MIRYLSILIIVLNFSYNGTSQIKLDLIGGLTSHRFFTTGDASRYRTHYRFKLGSTIGVYHKLKRSKIGLFYSFERQQYEAQTGSQAQSLLELFTRRAHFINTLYLIKIASIQEGKIDIRFGPKLSLLIWDKYDGHFYSGGLLGFYYTDYKEGFEEQRPINAGVLLDVEYSLKPNKLGLKSVSFFASFNVLRDFDSLLRANSFNTGFLIGFKQLDNRINPK